MMPQSTFMIAASVRSGELENLRQLLATMNRGIGEADPDNTLVPFGRFDRLQSHVLSSSKQTQQVTLQHMD